MFSQRDSDYRLLANEEEGTCILPENGSLPDNNHQSDPNDEAAFPQQFPYGYTILSGDADDASPEETNSVFPDAESPYVFDPQLLLYSIPFIYAAFDSLQTAMGMKDENKAIAYSCIALTFILSFSMNAKTTVEGFQETYDAVIRRQLPDDLQPLSRLKKATAITTATVLVAYVATSDSLQAFFLANSFPNDYKLNGAGWAGPFAALVTVATGITALFSEGFKNYRFIHESFVGRNMAYSNNLSRHVSPTLGTTLGLLSGANDAILSLVGISSVLKVKPGSAGVIAITGASLINGASETALQRFYVAEMTDSVIKTLATRYPTAKEAFDTTVSLAISGYVAMSVERLSISLLTDAAKLYEMNPSPAAISAAHAYAYLDAVNFGLLSAMYLYPYTQHATNAVTTCATRFARAIDNKITAIHENMLTDETLRARDIRMLSNGTDSICLLENNEHRPEQVLPVQSSEEIPMTSLVATTSTFFQSRRIGDTIRDSVYRHSSGYRNH